MVKAREALPVRRNVLPRVTAGMVEPLEILMGVLTRVGSRNEAAEGRRCAEKPLSKMGARDIMSPMIGTGGMK